MKNTCRCIDCTYLHSELLMLPDVPTADCDLSFNIFTMDVTKPECDTSSCNSTGGPHKEAMTPSSINALLKNEQTSFSEPQANYKEDVLAAVKLDPAVLEAQVTLTVKDKNVKTSTNSSEDFVEKKDQELGESSSSASSGTRFERILSMQKAALLSLPPQQFDYLLMYADSLRKKRLSVNKSSECAFCKNNGTSLSWYSGHGLKDGRGRVLCPVLRAYRCPNCGATGDKAHTIKYCPEHTNLY